MHLTLHMNRSGNVLAAYTCGVQYTNPISDGLASTNAVSQMSAANDFLAARLVVNGVAYRSASSHVGALHTAPSPHLTLRGLHRLALPAGTHELQVQWRKWGTYVANWTLVRAPDDGEAPSSVLLATARTSMLAAAQPITEATVSISDRWVQVTGARAEFVVPTQLAAGALGALGGRATCVLAFVMHLRPSTAPGATGMRANFCLVAVCVCASLCVSIRGMPRRGHSGLSVVFMLSLQWSH
ncbi:hypothetical protein EON66_00830 [archaeon]|nr:MAG: hypothetical protein EON66_00830 [archaeon]